MLSKKQQIEWLWKFRKDNKYTWGDVALLLSHMSQYYTKFTVHKIWRYTHQPDALLGTSSRPIYDTINLLIQHYESNSTANNRKGHR